MNILKNIKRNIISTLAILMLLFLIIIYVHSIYTLNNTKVEASIEFQNPIDERLSEKGFTQNQINQMKDRQKEMLLEEGKVIEVITKNYMLDEKVFSLKTTIEKLKEKNGYKYFRFTSEGTWNKKPKSELKDIIAVSWSDEFTLKEDFCYIDYRGLENQDEDDVMRESVGLEKGISHQINLRAGKDENRIVQVVEVYTNAKNSGSANVVSDYAHATLGIGDITAQFSGDEEFADIEFSAGHTIKFERASDSYIDFKY